MRYLVGLTAVAALAVQPVMASAAPAAKPVSAASSSRMQNVKLAMLQGRQNSQGDQNASQQAQCRANPNSVINPDGTCTPRPDGDGVPGQARRTTVLNGLIVALAGTAAIGGLTIALSRGGNKGAVSQ
jgi:hypothetical protein